MINNSAAKRFEEKQSERRPESGWTRIGINAVAAASICRDKAKQPRKDGKAERRAFPFSEDDYATD